MLRIALQLESALRHQRGYLLPWAPVCLALGIGTYFALQFEPDPAVILWLLGLSSPLLVWAFRDQSGLRAVPVAILLIVTGFTLAVWRAQNVAAPRLDLPYNGPLEGRVIAVDRSSSDALRLTLDQVAMFDLGPRPPPARVRISLHGAAEGFQPDPLQRISVPARLAPPSGPVEPWGFDFQRHAWFLQLGALGYTREPVAIVAPAEPGISIVRLRARLSDGIKKHLTGDMGAVAAAITTGDRSGLKKATADNLRATNLAHLLAISGLHMGLLVGVVFVALRHALALWPYVALRISVKKVASLGALFAAAVYLALSGGSIATERAFVMAAVALIAVLINRRAISMRSVAVAGVIVLLLRPESLFSPGFHMSFAATTALVWVYSFASVPVHWTVPKCLRGVFGVALTSFVAGAATAPFAAAHFNGYAAYGLPANLLAVPIMGAVVMPAAVAALCLAPFGLEGLALAVMGAGLQWILGVAAFFADLDGARRAVVSPPTHVLQLFSFGALVIMLWQRRWRMVGALPVLLAAGLWITVQRPLVLVEENGRLLGVMTEAGRAVSKKKGQGFAARAWLANDGDLADQESAYARLPAQSTYGFQVDLGPGQLWYLKGKKEPKGGLTCQSRDLVISAKPFDQDLACPVFDPKKLAKTGALAIYATEHGLKLISVADVRGQRLWSPGAQDQ